MGLERINMKEVEELMEVGWYSEKSYDELFKLRDWLRSEHLKILNRFYDAKIKRGSAVSDKEFYEITEIIKTTGSEVDDIHKEYELVCQGILRKDKEAAEKSYNERLWGCSHW